MNDEPFGPLAVIAPFAGFDAMAQVGEPTALWPGVLRLRVFGQDRKNAIAAAVEAV